LAEVFGVTHEYMVEQGHSYHVVSSNTWKSKLGIKGRTRIDQKKNAQEFVLKTYNKKVSQDEADAICIGASIVLEQKSAF
jgi:Asp/Glu/hydantoin racemase